MSALILAIAACALSIWSLAWQARWWRQRRRLVKRWKSAAEREPVRVLPPEAAP